MQSNQGKPSQDNRQIVSKLFNQGVNLEKSGDLSKALLVYKEVIRLQPQFREAYINLGSLLSRAHRFRLALSSFKKALKMKEDFVILFNLGVLFFRLRKFRSALLMLNKALALDNGFARLHLLLGFTYNQLGQVGDAERCYRNVLRIEKNHPQALFALTYLYSANRMLSEASRCLEALLKIDASSLELQKLKVKIGLQYGQMGDTDELFESLQNLVATDPAFNRDRQQLADSIRQDPQQYKRLQAEIDEKIAKLEHNIEPPSSRQWLDLSLLHLFQGNDDNAIRALLRAKVNLGEKIAS